MSQARDKLRYSFPTAEEEHERLFKEKYILMYVAVCVIFDVGVVISLVF
jgi:hypothetical protein